MRKIQIDFFILEILKYQKEVKRKFVAKNLIYWNFSNASFNFKKKYWNISKFQLIWKLIWRLF